MKFCLLTLFICLSNQAFSQNPTCKQAFQGGIIERVNDAVQYQRALLHHKLGRTQPEHYKIALRLLKALESKGNNKARHLLATWYFFGDGVKKDEERANLLFHKTNHVATSSNKEKRVFVYVDAWNLYYSIRKYGSWVNIESLVQSSLPPNYKLAEIKYYTSLSNKSPMDTHQRNYLKVLEEQTGVKIIYGRQVRGTIKNYNGDAISPRTYTMEKETDVNIGSDMIYDCCKKDSDVVVLVSRDTDFTRTLRMVKNVFNKEVIMLVVDDSTIPEVFQSFVDSGLYLGQKQVQRNQFPKVVRLKKWYKNKKTFR